MIIGQIDYLGNTFQKQTADDENKNELLILSLLPMILGRFLAFTYIFKYID